MAQTMTVASLKAQIEAGVPEAEQVVAVDALGGEYTRDELAGLFAMVEPAGNWKRPIETTVTGLSERQVRGMREAVIFFTGSVPHLSPTMQRGGGLALRVTAPGYYSANGA